MEEKEFIEWLEMKGLGKETIKVYRHYYNRFNAGNYPMNQIGVDQFLKDYKSNCVRALVKIYREFILTHADSFEGLNGLDIEEVRKVEFWKMTGRKKKRIKALLDDEDIFKIMPRFNYQRDRLILAISYFCGLRVSEAMSIKPLDFKWDDWDKRKSDDEFCELKIRGKGDKERIVFVPTLLAQEIDSYIKRNIEEHGGTFDESKTLFQITVSRWQKILRTATEGLFDSKKLDHINTHLLRHSFGTNMNIKGHSIEEIKELLGHESISTTQLYVHSNIEDLKKKHQEIMKEH